jgi:hypothetical protein
MYVCMYVCLSVCLFIGYLVEYWPDSCFYSDNGLTLISLTYTESTLLANPGSLPAHLVPTYPSISFDFSLFYTNCQREVKPGNRIRSFSCTNDATRKGSGGEAAIRDGLTTGMAIRKQCSIFVIPEKLFIRFLMAVGVIQVYSGQINCLPLRRA